MTNHTAPNKEITAQALGAAVVAVVLGTVQWFMPELPAPPTGLEAGFAVIAGLAVALIRKYLARRKMTEKELATDKALCAGRIPEE